jgi:pyruvate dehydrogenase E2 component (dihydrolipoamide acetyltransferase)
MARREIRVPDLGDFSNVEIVEVLVKAGDLVRAEQTLITLETDKAAMEVPSPVAGTLVEMKVAQGGRVSTGDLIAFVEADEAAVAATPAPARTPAPSPAPASAPASAPVSSPPGRRAPTGRTPEASRPASAAALPPIDESTFARAHASPSVRKFARELGVDLGRVKGSGQKGRVLLDDVKQFVKSVMSGAVSTGPALPAVPVVDFAKFGPVEISPLSRVRKISGPRLQAAWLNIPHVTQQDDADITVLEERRQALKNKAAAEGLKLTPLAFFVRAAVLALKEFPDFNSSLTEDGTGLVHKKYWHIGFAADTPQGLVVPVIRDADQKDVFGIARELGHAERKGPRWQAHGQRDAGRDLHDFEPGRHRWHLLQPDRQRARGRHPRRGPLRHAAGLGKGQICAAPDPAAVACLRSSRDRRRDRCPLLDLPRRPAGRRGSPAGGLSGNGSDRGQGSQSRRLQGRRGH